MKEHGIYTITFIVLVYYLVTPMSLARSHHYPYVAPWWIQWVSFAQVSERLFRGSEVSKLYKFKKSFHCAYSCLIISKRSLLFIFYCFHVLVHR